jgi:hypothetical protein
MMMMMVMMMMRPDTLRLFEDYGGTPSQGAAAT